MNKGTKLGKVQFEIMQILWDRGKATAREITDSLPGDEPLAHSTVQTLLRKLEAKGAVQHYQEGRTFVFKPKLKQAEVTRSAAQDLLSRVFQGSLSSMVAHLLKSEDVSKEELLKLRELIDATAEEKA